MVPLCGRFNCGRTVTSNSSFPNTLFVVGWTRRERPLVCRPLDTVEEGGGGLAPIVKEQSSGLDVDVRHRRQGSGTPAPAKCRALLVDELILSICTLPGGWVRRAYWSEGTVESPRFNLVSAHLASLWDWVLEGPLSRRGDCFLLPLYLLQHSKAQAGWGTQLSLPFQRSCSFARPPPRPPALTCC